MASTDYPLSVSSKFIDDAGTEHLVTVRGRNLDDFRNRLTEAGNIFPYAGFTKHDAVIAVSDHTPTTPSNGETPAPTPIKTQAQLTQEAHERDARARAAKKDASNGDRDNAPLCHEHGRKMRRSQFDDTYYCPAKVGDDYCDQRVAV